MSKMNKQADLAPHHVSDIIEMALSDHVQFADITRQYGLSESAVVALMRRNLKSGSYRAWRKRVSAFSKRREITSELQLFWRAFRIIDLKGVI